MQLEAKEKRSEWIETWTDPERWIYLDKTSQVVREYFTKQVYDREPVNNMLTFFVSGKREIIFYTQSLNKQERYLRFDITSRKLMAKWRTAW